MPVGFNGINVSSLPYGMSYGRLALDVDGTIAEKHTLWQLGGERGILPCGYDLQLAVMHETHR